MKNLLKLEIKLSLSNGSSGADDARPSCAAGAERRSGRSRAVRITGGYVCGARVGGPCLFLGARPERAFVAPAATSTILFKIVRRGSPGNERRAFLLLCVLCVFCVYDDCVDFCDVTMTHEHRRNALAPLGRCPPFRNIETPFCSATLCRTRHAACAA